MRVATLATLAILVSATAASADPANLRLGVSATMLGQHPSFATDVEDIPGPGVSADYAKPHGDHFAVGGHLGWSSSFTRADVGGSKEKAFQQLIEAHLLLEWRYGPVAFGGSIGLDLLGVNGSYADMNGDPDHLDEALGVRAHVAVRMAEIESGTFAVTGSASMFSLMQWSGACGGELSCAEQAKVVSIGVAFTPR